MMMAVCSDFISESQTIPAKQTQVDSCVKVATEADRQGVVRALAMSVGWSESRFMANSVSPKGAIGVMQVLPIYWCPNKRSCDSIVFGVKALNHYLKTNSRRDALCRYASGKSCKKNTSRYRYMRLVLKNADRFKDILE